MSEPTFEVTDAAGFAPHVGAAVAIYASALGRPADVLPSRAMLVREHLDYPGLRAVLARVAGRLVGFAYGLDDTSGQWWHDVVAAALPPQVRAEWLADAFQVTEVHVLPEWQGRGIGRRLMHLLTAGATRPTAVLSAFDADTPARRLYRSLGFVELLRGFRFPGNDEAYVILGARLPLPAAAPADATTAG